MERSSNDGGLSPQQKITYATYLFTKNSPQGRYDGVIDVAKDALQHIDDLKRSERLRLFTILMQSPGARLTAKQKKILASDTVVSMPKIPSAMLVKQYLLRTYHGFGISNTGAVVQQAESICESDATLDETKSFAHILICAYGERVVDSIDWLQKNGDEFSLTEGVRLASGRFNGRWRAQMHIDQALEKVRHPILRARLLTKRIEIYTKMLRDQDKEYDHRVNEQKDVIMRAIREAFIAVRKTAGATESQVSSYYNVGLLYAHEGDNGTARMMLSKAVEMAEIYGLSGLAIAAQTAMYRMSQPE